METALQIVDMNVPVGSLDSYIARVNQIPMLSAEQERDLAGRFHDENDLNAAKQLVLSHLRFVVRVAKDYAGYGLAIGDLIQEGNIGLMKAVKRFDPSKGVRLVSFAVHWIKSEIHEFVIRNWRIVKIATTKAQRKCFFNLRKMKDRLGWFSDAEINDVAKELGVSPKEVIQMEMRLGTYDAPFDTAPSEDEEHLTPAYYLEDTGANPALLCSQDNLAAAQSEKLTLALESLDDRARAIIHARWLAEDKATLHELAEKFNVSAERIRQLEKQAFDKMKAAFTE